MDETELKKLNVTIAGRDYPVKVKETETEMIQWVVKEINEKLQDLQLKYNKNDLQDCLSMTLLTYAVDYHQDKQPQQEGDVTDQFNKIHKLLDTMLQS